MKRLYVKIICAMTVFLSAFSGAKEVYASDVEDVVSQYDEIIEEDDTADAAIYNKGVIIGGVEKTDETCELTIEAKGLEYLNEDFDKEIYALLTNVYTYSEYGITLDKKHEYKATMNLPAGQYILTKVGLTHGRAIDYFSIHKEVTCAPGTKQDFWFKLYSYKVELQKAEQQQIEVAQKYVEAAEAAEDATDTTVSVIEGPGKSLDVARVEPPQKDTFINMLMLGMSVIFLFFIIKGYEDKKRKKKELDEQEDIF